MGAIEAGSGCLYSRLVSLLPLADSIVTAYELRAQVVKCAFLLAPYTLSMSTLSVKLLREQPRPSYRKMQLPRGRKLCMDPNRLLELIPQGEIVLNKRSARNPVSANTL